MNNLFLDDDFCFEDFLNPKTGSKQWLEEQPEKLRVMIDNKQYKDAITIVKNLKQMQLDDFLLVLSLDDIYSYLIEKLTLSIQKIKRLEDIIPFIQHLIDLNCIDEAISSFLSWLSKKLKNKVISSLSSMNSDQYSPGKKIIKAMDVYFTTLFRYTEQFNILFEVLL